jgi:hypothetical protein
MARLRRRRACTQTRRSRGTAPCHSRVR